MASVHTSLTTPNPEAQPRTLRSARQGSTVAQSPVPCPGHCRKPAPVNAPFQRPWKIGLPAEEHYQDDEKTWNFIK